MGLFSSRTSVTIPPPGPTEQLQTDLLGQLSQMLFNFLGREPTDEELQGMLEPIFSLAGRRGGEAIQQRGIEAAGGRGLNLSDTPIAAPLLREQRELTEGLESARASAILNLRQQALENRFRLGQMFTGGIGTLGGIRAGQRTITSTPSLFDQLGMGIGALSGLASGIPGIASGIGGLFGGTASVAPTGPFGLSSSREFKKDLKPLSESEHSEATEEIRDTPIYTYRYKSGLGLAKGERIGPVTEESPPVIVTGRGKLLDVGNTIGLGLAAIKDIDARVRALEEDN